jgi:hypothetical protein
MVVRTGQPYNRALIPSGSHSAISLRYHMFCRSAVTKDVTNRSTGKAFSIDAKHQVAILTLHIQLTREKYLYVSISYWNLERFL